MRKLYAPHQALRASFPHRGKPRVNQKRGFACARIVLIASSILHSTFYILHLSFAQGRGRVAYAARGKGARQGGSAARGAAPGVNKGVVRLPFCFCKFFLRAARFFL